MTSVFLGIYQRYVLLPLQSQSFLVAPLRVVYLYLAKPAFWLCLGLAGATVLCRRPLSLGQRRMCVGLGIGVVAVYCAAYLLSLARVPLPLAQALVRWFTHSAAAFLTAGALIGLGCAGTETA